MFRLLPFNVQSVALSIYTVIIIGNQWRIQDFPLGGAPTGAELLEGAPTSDMGAFWQKHMRKRKNWILLGGGGGHAGGIPTGSANGNSMNEIGKMTT